jgi:hypothetical protein
MAHLKFDGRTCHRTIKLEMDYIRILLSKLESSNLNMTYRCRNVNLNSRSQYHQTVLCKVSFVSHDDTPMNLVLSAARDQETFLPDREQERRGLKVVGDEVEVKNVGVQNSIESVQDPRCSQREACAKSIAYHRNTTLSTVSNSRQGPRGW